MPTMDERVPGSYDPTNPTPYKPPEGSGMPSPMDQITAPPRRDPSETQQPQAPNIAPHKKGGTLGSIAFLGDSLLRGFMRGKEQSEQVKVYKANRLMQGFQSAYDTAKRRMLELAKNGDTTSKEYLDAKAAADAAWQAKIQMYGNYMGADKGKGKGKKSKSGGQGDGEQENPLTMLQSKDPHEQARGWLAITKQSGPDYNSEIKQYQTPEYQQWVKTRRGEGALTQGNVEDRTELRKLEMTDTSKMSEGERTEHQKKIGALRSRISEVNTGYSQQEKKLDKRISPDNHEQILWEKPDGTREWRDEGAVRAPASETKPQWFMDEHGKPYTAEVDPATNQEKPNTRNYNRMPPPGTMTTTRTGEQLWTDNDGYTWKIPVHSTTTHTGPGHKPSPPVPGAEVVASPGGSAAAQQPAQQPSQRSAQQPSKPAAASTATAGEGHTPPVPGATMVGKHKLSQSEAKSESVVADTYKKMKPLFGLLGAQEDYMKEIEKDPSKASPRQDLSLVVAAVRSMNPGSVRLPQKELELELKAGSYGDRLRRLYDNASTGLLPDDQRKDLFSIVQRETSKAGESIAKDWQQYMSGQPLPSDIQRFAKASSSAPQGASDEVYAADNKTLIGHIVNGKYVALPKQ